MSARARHLWIVKRGVSMARNQGPSGQAFYDLFRPDDIQGRDAANRFQVGLCMGLYEADFKSLYNNRVVFPTYASHFYDPDTQLNWLGQAEPTALTMGRTLFAESLTAYHANNVILAGYKLGLALHYLTDVGQPQHAANFTNVDMPMGWHAGFEEVRPGVPRWRRTVRRLHSSATAPDQDRSRRSLRQSRESIEAALYRASNRTISRRARVSPGPGLFTVEEAPSILAPMLQNAIRAVLYFVLDWIGTGSRHGGPGGV